jgi:hypothetical protein
MSSASQEQLIYLRIPDHALAELADNGIDLVQALRDGGLDVRASAAPDPTRPADGRKDIVLALLAVGAAAPLVGIAIAKVLDALGRNRKYLVSERALVQATDAHGHPAVDDQGRPVMYWSEKQRLIEAGVAGTERSSAKLHVPGLLEFELKSE